AATALTAQAQERVAAAGQGDVAEVVVTGSRIRRVDAETANPVLVIDQAAIQASGVTSAGDLVQRIPSIAGAATNPQVNNGGGFGEANIELRGLDAKRTLILVDGRRIGLVGASDATDVNQIPVSMIERVEVLKEGAGAIYGSDAVGGVVNFITRKDLDGLEVSADYGRTSHKDGAHYSVDATFGTSTDKFSFMVGGNYSEQKAVSAGDRDFSKYALYFYGGAAGITQAGSSRTPNGRIDLPDSLAAQFPDCDALSRNEGASGLDPVADYHCYSTANDSYNFQPLNLLMTPQERTALFTKVNYRVSDNVEIYATGINNRTHSGFQIAPLPFDANTDDVIISKDNMYNPFGVDFGGIAGANGDFRLRMSSLGNRQSETQSDSKIFNGGVKGKFGDWEWDLNLTSSRLDQLATIDGYLLKAALGPALGPSYPDRTTGVPTCGIEGDPSAGIPDQPISGCIPVNFFNPTTPDQVAALQTISSNYNTNNKYKYRAAALDVNGKLFSLPAGDVLSSFGLEYNDRWGQFTADSIVQAQPPLYLQCQLANETCTGNTLGSYNSRQAYAEFFVPLLKDLPGVHALNVDLGVRYSDYNLFGNETTSDFKLEYRPIEDLLVRGTYSQIFRVPTITDLAASPVNSAVTFTDPCTNLTQAQVDANPNLALACQGVPRTGDYNYGLSQITGLLLSNPDLKPETGNVKTFGVVYEPNFVRGLSVELDYWKYHIADVITTLDPNYSITQCANTGDPEFCSLVTRYTSGPNAGDILVFQAPTVNLGSLDTDGYDVGLRYQLRDTGLGSFQFSIDATHINSYESTPSPGAEPQEVAGTYDRQFGNYAKWRAVAQIGWTYQDFEALLAARYIDKAVLNNPATEPRVLDPNNDFEPTGEMWPSQLNIPSVTYIDLSVGYTIAATNTKVQFGVLNLSDKQPPLLYLNNVTNANTDVETYDAIGRRWFASVTQKF
ncbi:MAG TPA: TonB-dependent receptor, partial [Steroidobacteraceae bacterium]|nr:TonB-dependent receptor [Steroidobacteraceae bacterium]